MLKDRIKNARKAAGKTQKEVAIALGVTESTYCGYETGKRQPDAIKVSKIAAILGVTGDYLLDLPETVAAPELTPEEAELLEIYRIVNDQGKALITANARMIRDMESYRA